MDSLWRDSIGFAGAKMIRRIVGISHVADIEKIEDIEVRALVEKRSLLLAKEMVLESQRGSGTGTLSGISGVKVLVERAREHYSIVPPATW
jgi:5-methylthioribose kinase